MKNFALGFFVFCGFASASFAQDCVPVYCCAVVPAPTMTCNTFFVQETAPAAIPQEPISGVEQSNVIPQADPSLVPSSVLISPVPEHAPLMESAPVLGAPMVPVSGTVYSNNSRSNGGRNFLRRRSVFMGRFFGRYR